MAGVDEDSVRSYAEIHGAVGEAPCGDDDVDDNVVVRDAVRPGAWLGMPCVRADETNPGLGSDNGEVRVDTTPRVVDEVSPGGDSGATDICPPRVDRDDDRGVTIADRRNERCGAPDLLLGVDRRSGAGLHATDVD